MKSLQQTQTICPVCKRPLPAFYEEEAGRVFLRKTCPEHGRFESFIAENAEDFIDWIGHPVLNIPPKQAITKGIAKDCSCCGSESAGECPLHCGTCENHLQTACCVLIDITQRCNQHCPYCFARAEEDVTADLPLAEIERKYDLLLELGEERPFNIQLSGGEPTVRDDLPEIIGMGRDKGFEYIQINTNGRRLALEEGYAKVLKRAGASVVFLQFDGTNDEIYQALRGEPLLEIKKRAVANCRRAGLPVTLVPTVVKHINLGNIGEMMQFLLANADVVKGIHFQPVSFFGRCPERAQENTRAAEEVPVHRDYENRVTMFDIMREVERQSAGKFHYSDFCPITTGHTLCCFYGTFRREAGGGVKSLLSEESKRAGVSCCGPSASELSCCGPALQPLDVIKKDRDFVLNKWDLPEEEECCGTDQESAGAGCCSEAMDFDSFLRELKANRFTVSAMAFQDESNLDAERLKRCRVQQLTDDDRLIPFCAYNAIYRK